MGTQVNGGARRDRTADLLHAMQALSQLSYSPKNEREFFCIRLIMSIEGVKKNGGAIAPPSRLEGTQTSSDYFAPFELFTTETRLVPPTVNALYTSVSADGSEAVIVMLRRWPAASAAEDVL
jgi:hypothetical protein